MESTRRSSRRQFSPSFPSIGPDYFTAIQPHILEGRAIDSMTAPRPTQSYPRPPPRPSGPARAHSAHQFDPRGPTSHRRHRRDTSTTTPLRAEPATSSLSPYSDGPPFATYFLIRTQQGPRGSSNPSQHHPTTIPMSPCRRVHTLDDQLLRLTRPRTSRDRNSSSPSEQPLFLLALIRNVRAPLRATPSKPH